MIDDGKARGHNADSVKTAAHRPADLDLLMAICLAVADLYPEKPMVGFPSDLESAYRQVTSDPFQAVDFVITSSDTDRDAQVFCMAATHLCGIGHAPFYLTRCAEFCCKALASFVAVLAVHGADDVIVLGIVHLFCPLSSAGGHSQSCAVGTSLTRSPFRRHSDSGPLGRSWILCDAHKGRFLFVWLRIAWMAGSMHR